MPDMLYTDGGSARPGLWEYAEWLGPDTCIPSLLPWHRMLSKCYGKLYTLFSDIDIIIVYMSLSLSANPPDFCGSLPILRPVYDKYNLAVKTLSPSVNFMSVCPLLLHFIYTCANYCLNQQVQ